jgi:hypothetical protein
MTVELWYGKKPENPAEQNVLIDLYDFLRGQPEHFVVLSTFYPGKGHEIDLTVLKRDAWFVAEIKHVWGKVVGAKNGEWKCLDADGVVQKTIRNPYLQVRGSYAGLRDWTGGNSARIRPAPAPGKEIDLRSLKPIEYIVLHPHIPAGSEIDIGEFPVEVVDLNKLRAALVMRTLAGFDFTCDELQAIPTLLNLTQWHIDRPVTPPEPPVTEGGRITKVIKGDYHLPIVRMLVAREHEYSPQVFHLSRDVVSIGRGPDCDLDINHESVSRKHGEIRWDRDLQRWIVRDFSSRNGIFVSYNGDPSSERRIERSNVLKNGSIVRFGQASFTFLLDEGE